MADKYSGSKNGFSDRTIVDMLEKEPSQHALVGFPDLNKEGPNFVPSEFDPDNIGTGISLSNNNHTFTKTSAGWTSAISKHGVTSGKYYVELECNKDSGLGYIGFCDDQGDKNTYPSNDQHSGGWYATQLYRNEAAVGGSTNLDQRCQVGDILMIAIDMDNHKLWFGKNGVWMDSGNPANNTGEQFDNLPTETFIDISINDDTRAITTNFGQDNFTYTVPSGFTAGFGTDAPRESFIYMSGGPVSKIKPDGTEVWQNDALVGNKYGIAVDSDFNVYVGHSSNLSKLSPDGSTVLWTYTGFAHEISAMVRHPDGGVIATGSGTVRHISAAGTLVWSYAAPAGTFVSVNINDSDVIHVGNTLTTIYRITKGGLTINNISAGSSGSIYKVIFLPDSTDLIVCYYTHTVRITSAGTNVWTGATGADLDFDVAVDSSGNLYVGSGDNKLRKIKSSDGTLIWSHATHDDCQQVEIDSSDNIYCDNHNAELIKLSVDNVVDWQTNFNGANPYGLIAVDDVDKTGGYVTDNTNNIDLTGKSIITKARYNADISFHGSVTMLVSFDGRATWNYWDGSGWVDSGGVDHTHADTIENTMAALEMSRLEAGDTYLDFALRGFEGGYGDPSLNRIDIEVR